MYVINVILQVSLWVYCVVNLCELRVCFCVSGKLWTIIVGETSLSFHFFCMLDQVRQRESCILQRIPQMECIAARAVFNTYSWQMLLHGVAGQNVITNCRVVLITCRLGNMCLIIRINHESTANRVYELDMRINAYARYVAAMVKRDRRYHGKLVRKFLKNTIVRHSR